MKTSEPYGHLVLFVKVASVFALLMSNAIKVLLFILSFVSFLLQKIIFCSQMSI